LTICLLLSFLFYPQEKAERSEKDVVLWRDFLDELLDESEVFFGEAL